MLEIDQIPPGTLMRDLVQTVTDPVSQVPRIVVKGKRQGPVLLVTAGVHGAEYASIEAANRLARIDPLVMSGTLVVLPVVNQPSFAARSIYLNPLDGKNLNRVFPGLIDGTFADQLAYWLTHTLIAHADAYIDLHGGGLNEALTPFVIYAPGDSQAERYAHAFGLPNVIASAIGGSSYAAGTALGVPSIVAEAGGQGQFPERDVSVLVDGVQRVMQVLGMLPGEAVPVQTTTYSAFVWLRSRHAGFWYLEVAPGDTVVVGQRLGFIKDFRGEVVQEATFEVAGKVVFAVTSLAINPDDPLVAVGC